MGEFAGSQTKEDVVVTGAWHISKSREGVRPGRMLEETGVCAAPKGCLKNPGRTKPAAGLRSPDRGLLPADSGLSGAAGNSRTHSRDCPARGP